MGASPTGNGSVQSAHQGRREPGQWGVQVQGRVVGLHNFKSQGRSLNHSVMHSLLISVDFLYNFTHVSVL